MATKRSGLIMLLLLAVTACCAQTGAGSVQGTVKDSSGAVVPSARLTLLHQQTARSYQTFTNEVGFYLFPSLQPGSYKLSVDSAGMESWNGELLLQAGQSATIDPALKVAGTATGITVAGDVSPLVTVVSPTLGNAVERARIEQLPLNGRFFQTLVQATTPGVEGTDKPRVYGMRLSAMEFTQDGATIVQRDTGGVSSRPPGLDTIAEFRIETNNSSAKLSRPATTIVSTKSGSNEIHGAAFETARNNAVGVARRRQDFYEKAPHLVRNEFGASLGGPVFLPRLYNGRNRTFFFAAWEAYRYEAAVTTSTTMPTLAMRQGDFRGLVDGTGRRYTLYDPWTTDAKSQRLPFSDNVIPMTRQGPLAKYLYSVTPEPTLPSVNPLVSSNYYGPSPESRHDNTQTFRIDHRLSDKDQLFGRYSYGTRWTRNRRDFSSNGSPITLDGLAQQEIQSIPTHNAMLSWVRIFSPTFFSETIATGYNEDFQFNLPEFSKAGNVAKELGLPNPFNSPGLPDLSGTGFGMWYQGIRYRNPMTRVFTGDQNFTKIVGRHELQFGGRVRYEQLGVLADQETNQGSHSFSSLATALYDPSTGSAYGAVPFTGHDSANLFLGVAGSYSGKFSRGWYHLRGHEYAPYLQDNFKVNSRLTLNLGLRWEVRPTIREVNNFLSSFDPATKSIVNGSTLEKLYKLGATTPAIVSTYTSIGVKFVTTDQAGLPAHFMNSNFRDFMPRAGFAYRFGSARRTTVLRGGYSLFGFQIPLRSFYVRLGRNAPSTATFTMNYNSSAQSPDRLPNYFLRNAPTVIAGVNSAGVLDPNAPSAVARGGFTTYYFNPDQPTSISHEWNLMLEREIWNNTVVRAGYVGTRGANLDQYYTYNNAPNNYIWFTNTRSPLPTGEYSGVARRPFDQTTYGEISEYRRMGFSNFNGIQLEVQHRYSRGYGFQLFYVMSNAFGAWAEQENALYSMVDTENLYLPGAVPKDLAARDRFLNYRRDTGLPKHRLNWNWIVDLPFGRGKRLAGSAKGFWDRLVGGWQIAGFGSIRSNYWSLPTNNWGYLGTIETYGKKYPIQDCRSGTCIPGYLWYNGYLPANRINSVGSNGRPNGVMGVPDGYQPAHKPVIPIPADGGRSTDPNFRFYDSNTVWVPLKDGTLQQTSLDTNLHPWRNQFLPGPRSAGLDASLFKSIRVVERFSLRFNADFFNVLNMPGLTQPDSSTGILSLRNSANTPRQLQLTLRLIW